MKERWKKIEKSPTYEVSNLGRVRNSRGKILRMSFVSGGLAATLCVESEKTSVRLARLVGKAFCNGYRDDRYPIYKDGDNSNCAASNLKWVPRSKVCGKPYSVKGRNTKAMASTV